MNESMRVDLEKIFGKQDNGSHTTVDPKSVLVLEEMRSRYGGETSIETILSKLKGNKIHRCPKCHGKGYIEEAYNAYPTNLPDSGWVEDIKYRKIKCDLCGGEGWTEHEYKPITKKVVEGWTMV